MPTARAGAEGRKAAPDGSPPRARVLLLAYACSPYRGSEASVGWHRALDAAREFDTWVICEETWCAPDIRAYIAANGAPAGVTFAFVPMGRWLRLLRRVPGLFYLAYNLWHRRGLAAARRLHRHCRFDLVHQVTFCGFREPGYLWKLGVPFVWGPVGGTQHYPWRFLLEAGPVGAVTETLRTLANGVQLRFSPRVRRAARTAASVFAANSTNARDMERFLGIAPAELLETGLPRLAASHGRQTPHDPIRLLWSGELRAFKGLPLLLRALARLPASTRFELRVVGGGPMRRRWHRMASRLGVDANTTWVGTLPHRDALLEFEWADVLVFTSLRDTSGNVALEALGAAVPVMCLDHQGVHDIVTDDCGLRIPVTAPGAVVEGLRDAVLRLSTDRALFARLSAGALARAHDLLWSVNGATMRSTYRRVLGRPARYTPMLETGRAPVRERAKRAGSRVAAGLDTLFGSRAGDAFGILAYHRVVPVVEGLAAPDPTHNVTPRRFREQIVGLLDRGFQIWPLARALDYRRRGQPVPAHAVVLTFDDAHDSVYGAAWPILRELQLPATVFLATAFVGSAEPFPFDRWGLRYRDRLAPEWYRPISERQCRAMAESGLIELGAHTHTHRDFRGRPGAFRVDLATSVAWLRRLAPRGLVPFAFPFGHTDPELLAVAREAGVSCGLTTAAALVPPAADPFGWARFNVYGWDTAASIAAKLHGWYGWLPALGQRVPLLSGSSLPRRTIGGRA
jgi:glycosyltransferase involved in cell wall biosynthesis/peptidoglycan/xylan/chitin deacetylase (PgdA/CDA1 family)